MSQPRVQSARPLSVNLFGIAFQAHWSSLVLVLLMGWQLVTHGVWIAATTFATVLIVIFHELGHALVCRWLGGRVDKVVLWPFGGIAHVTPPNRAGAMFWTVLGGPAANVALILPFYALCVITNDLHWAHANLLVRESFAINFLILAFNLLPLYPLDGARLMQTVLWRICGKSRAVSVSGLISLACAGAGIIAGVASQSPLLGITGLCGAAFSMVEQRRARAMAKRMSHHRTDHQCPTCHTGPAIGPFWKCDCGHPFDTFAEHATCPICQKRFGTTSCLACHAEHPLEAWKIDIDTPAQTSPT